MDRYFKRVASRSYLVNLTLNTIGSSYKRKNDFHKKQAEIVEKAFYEGDI